MYLYNFIHQLPIRVKPELAEPLFLTLWRRSQREPFHLLMRLPWLTRPRPLPWKEPLGSGVLPPLSIHLFRSFQVPDGRIQLRAVSKQNDMITDLQFFVWARIENVLLASFDGNNARAC